MSIVSYRLSVKEKMGYSLGDLSANLVFQTLMTYLAYFYAGIFGLEAGHASVIILTVGLREGYLFYHNSSLSKGVTHLRSIKVAEMEYDGDGKIETEDPYRE